MSTCRAYSTRVTDDEKSRFDAVALQVKRECAESAERWRKHYGSSLELRLTAAAWGWDPANDRRLTERERLELIRSIEQQLRERNKKKVPAGAPATT